MDLQCYQTTDRPLASPLSMGMASGIRPFDLTTLLMCMPCQKLTRDLPSIPSPQCSFTLTDGEIASPSPRRTRSLRSVNVMTNMQSPGPNDRVDLNSRMTSPRARRSAA